MAQILVEQCSIEGREFLEKVAEQLRKLHVERNALIDLIQAGTDWRSPDKVNFGSVKIPHYQLNSERTHYEIVGERPFAISGEFNFHDLGFDDSYVRRVDTDKPIDVNSFWYASDQDC